MTQKSAKKKAKKSSKRAAEQGVLGSLRSTRPDRLGSERRHTARRASTTASSPAVERARETKAELAKPAPKKARATKAKSAKPKPAKSTVRPTKPVVPGPRPTGPRNHDGRPSGGEIVTTAVQAAGELAQIGATVGAQWLKRATRRIPRP